MSKKYDVCAIGNALIDYEIEVGDQFFDDHKIEKGQMTLVDEARQEELIAAASGKIKKKQGGGSAANTIFGLTAFGGKGFYTCKVAEDEDGKLFVDDLGESKIDTNLNSGGLFDGTTGKCLVMITPDAERTMNTFLGITSDFSKDQLVEEAIADSEYLFMEGFLVSSSSGLEAMKQAKEMARKHDVKVGLTFSDPSMVMYCGDQMKEIVGEGVDLLFCNIEEARLFTGKEQLGEVKEALERIASQFAITMSEKGSLVYDGEKYIEIAPFPTKAIDSTGAGDMFAGAFLYGLTNGYTHEKSGKLASAASSVVVSKYGPRISQEHVRKILKMIE